MYVAKFSEAVYVLHAFEKRTEQTAKHDIEVAKTRPHIHRSSNFRQRALSDHSRHTFLWLGHNL
jgi:phage-related protein